LPSLLCMNTLLLKWINQHWTGLKCVSFIERPNCMKYHIGMFQKIGANSELVLFSFIEWKQEMKKYCWNFQICFKYIFWKALVLILLSLGLIYYCSGQSYKTLFGFNLCFCKNSKCVCFGVSVCVCVKCICVFVQRILKGEVSLYHWPPVWLVWYRLYDNWQFLFLFVKYTNPNQTNRRSTVQLNFPL